MDLKGWSNPMPRTPARFTQADLARAARVAVETGLRVRVETKTGDIVLEREGKKQADQVDSQQREWAM